MAMVTAITIKETASFALLTVYVKKTYQFITVCKDDMMISVL